VVSLGRITQALQDGNVQAFLRVIRFCEGTADPDGYRRMFGGKLFDSFADHPRQKQTYSLKKGGTLTSSAAGAYQFLAKTWDGLVARYGFPNFFPETQDLAAVALIDGRKALDDLIAGNLPAVVKKCALEWASLPGSPYGQPTKTYAEVLREYEAHGGLLSPAGQKEKHMPAPIIAALPGLIALANSAIEVFSPVAQQKITKELSRHTDPETAGQIAGGVIEVVKSITGKDDPIQAVAAVRADPDMASEAERATLDKLEVMLPLLQQIHKMDQEALAAAHQRNLTQPPISKNMAMWITLALLPLVYMVVAAVLFGEQFSSDMKAMVIGAVVTGVLGAIVAYWLGSSFGSWRKTEASIKTDLALREPA
jgi:muramidase (phage lysozyme)